MTMQVREAAAAWGDLLGSEAVVGAAGAEATWGTCTTGAVRKIAGALRPVTTDSIPEIVRIARDHGVPLYPISTGHNWGYGTALPVRDDCVILDLSLLTRILAFDADTGVVTVEPGVTQAMLADFLAHGGHPYLVPVHGGGPTCSILGNAIERGYGITPYTDHFGAVLALEAVMADGSIYRSPLPELAGPGTAPGFKWGIGPYLDGLFTQSGFGVVTNVTIALARTPSRVKAIVFGLPDDRFGEGIVAIREVLRRLPGIVGGLNLMNAHRVLAMAIPYPTDLVGADGLIPAAAIARLAAKHHVHAWTGFGTLYGTQGVVRAAQREIARLLRPHVRQLAFVGPTTLHNVNRVRQRLGLKFGGFGRKLELLQSGLELVQGRPNETAVPLAYWRSGRLPGPGNRLDPARDGCGLIWYAPLVPIAPKRVVRYVEFVSAGMRAHRLEPLITLTSISDRCFDSTVPLLFDRNDPDEVQNARKCVAELLEAGCREGFAPYRVGVDSMPWLDSRNLQHGALTTRIKDTLDPYRILAPGRYG
ncbi:MAG: FAD-binding oxidoreductase [Betaproteobacteria bacterium]